MKETMTDKQVTYTLEYNNKFYIIENVPARVCEETGEQYFSPSTVEHVQDLIDEKQKPIRVVETPVYDFS